MNKRITTAVACLSAAMLALGGTAGAATPNSGTIGTGSPGVSWSGTTLAPAGGVYCPTSSDPLCDHFFLTVTSLGWVKVAVAAAPSDDWDVYIRNAAGIPIASDAGLGNPTVCFPATAGSSFEIGVAPFLTPSGDYSGSALFSTSKPAGC